jgi:DNA-binding NarL/FixJ family response regulator
MKSTDYAAFSSQLPGSPPPESDADRITVAVLGDDPLMIGRVGTQLTTAPDVRVVPDADSTSADVIVVLTTTVTDQLLTQLNRFADEATNPTQRTVLVADHLRQRHLPQIFRSGVVSVLPRRGAATGLIMRAVLTSHGGGAMLPETVTRWLVDETRTFQSDMLASNGLQAGGLTPREVDVLKLLADGTDTPHIAQVLSYSERTIKKIIQDMLTRLNLHNRAHAVSYALRVGAI